MTLRSEIDTNYIRFKSVWGSFYLSKIFGCKNCKWNFLILRTKFENFVRYKNDLLLNKALENRKIKEFFTGKEAIFQSQSINIVKEMQFMGKTIGIRMIILKKIMIKFQ
jgi:hypothetical protein